MTTTPPISVPSSKPSTVTIGMSAFLQRVPADDRSLRQSLGVRGADVVLMQHVEQTGAQKAGEEGRFEETQAERRAGPGA